MTAALAEAPGIAWFVPAGVPGRRADAPTPGRRRARLVPERVPTAPSQPARTRIRTGPDRAPQPRLRLTRRGARALALVVLALTIFSGLGRVENPAPVVATPAATQVAPGQPLGAGVALRASQAALTP